MHVTLKSAKQLNNGSSMPLLGLGVSRIDPLNDTERVVSWALKMGYRHIDTAKLYKNEKFVGRAIRKSSIARKDVWVTTKLWPTDFHHPRKALEESLKQLNMEHVDLYLIHWPTPIEIPGVEKRLWRAMEQLMDAGLCKTIGVSNYQIARLKKILTIANVPPAVNQVRCSPFYYPAVLHQFCREQGIALEGYGPLTRGSKLQDQAIKDLAEKHRKTAAQILLRWALQKDIVVIPKTQNEERLRENSLIYDFSLSGNDMRTLEALNETTD